MAEKKESATKAEAAKVRVRTLGTAVEKPETRTVEVKRQSEGVLVIYPDGSREKLSDAEFDEKFTDYKAGKTEYK